VVLAPPVPRTAERVAARFGDLAEAPVRITQGGQLPLAGLLLALPGLEMTGLLEVAKATFGPMRKGFYGLRVVLLMGVFMALLRQPRAEAVTRMRPADLGRLLGLDRAPEVKTLRRKLAEIAGLGKGAQLQGALGAHHAATRPDAVGFLYLDGHVRVYSGSRQLPKTHIARMRIAGPATEETWVGDSDGDPVMVITAAPSQSLAAELHRLLPQLRALIGPDRRCTLVFDRGGYSPQVFSEIIAADMDLLTYYKGAWTRAAVSAFTTVDYTAPDGSTHQYELAERPITLPVPGQPATAGTAAAAASTVTLRLIIRRSPDGRSEPGRRVGQFPRPVTPRHAASHRRMSAPRCLRICRRAFVRSCRGSGGYLAAATLVGHRSTDRLSGWSSWLGGGRDLSGRSLHGRCRSVGGQPVAAAVSDDGAGGDAEASSDLVVGVGAGEPAERCLLFTGAERDLVPVDDAVDGHFVDDVLRLGVAGPVGRGGGPALAFGAEAGAHCGGLVAGVLPLEVLVECVDGGDGARRWSGVAVHGLPGGALIDAGRGGQLFEVPSVGD